VRYYESKMSTVIYRGDYRQLCITEPSKFQNVYFSFSFIICLYYMFPLFTHVTDYFDYFSLLIYLYTIIIIIYS